MTYDFVSVLWVWDARRTDTWTFVSLPEDVADDILDRTGAVTRGFGSVRVEVTVGHTVWRTSIFPDSAAGTYVLPVKKAVRSAEGLGVGDQVSITLGLLDV